jgi:hypothetical protein
MLRRVPILFGLTFFVFGCQKENPPPSESAASSDAGAPRKEALDPDLAQAVAAASALRPGGRPAAVEGGPPPNGIFAPGAADKEIAHGQAPKLTLGSDGAEPRVALFPAQPKPGSKQSGTIQVVQQAQGAGLPVEFSVTFEAQKPKAEGATAVPVTVRVTGARVAVSGAPKEVESQVGKLRGTKIEYEISPDGAGTNYRYDLAKGASPELGEVVRALTDTLAVVTLPYPEKPVGVGAFWMATSRDGTMGLDLVTYRMIKVEHIEGKTVSLNVNTKRYSAGPSFDLPGLPPDAPRNLAEFQSLAEGSLQIEAGKGFPVGGTQNSAFGAQLQSPTNPAQRGMLEVRTRAELKLGGS